MELSITWHIGKEGAMVTCLDVPQYRAHIFYLRDERGLIEVQDFNLDELWNEIERRQVAGEYVEQFQETLKSLA